MSRGSKLGAAIGLCVALLVRLVAAQTYTGIDLLFLVDQSGSMGGQAFGSSTGGQGNDPLNLRFEAVQYAIDTLGQYRLTLAPEVAIRAGVINFGDAPNDADLALGWREIAVSGDVAEWEAQRETLLESLSAETFTNRNLGNTNFIGVFEAAQQMFSRLPADENHLRAIVLLTDGAPCAPDLFDCESYPAQQDHMRELLQQTQLDFPDPPYRIYVIALDATGDLWARWQTDWEAVAREAARVGRAENGQQVGVRFLTILGELIDGVRGASDHSFVALTPGSNVVNVPPYMQEMRVSIFKAAASPGVLGVTRPDGSVLTTGDPSLTIQNADRVIEVWSIDTPVPGDWRFDIGSAGDRIDVYLELIPVQAEAVVTGGSFIQNDDVNIEVRLLDANGNPLVIYDAPYDLRVQAVITAPDGSTSDVPLSRLPDNSFAATVTADQRGVYTVGVSASTASNVALLKTPTVNTFEVIGVVFQAEDLPTNQYLVGSTIDVRARLTDENGQTLPLDDIAVTAELALADQTTIYRLNALDAATGEYSQLIDLTEAGELTLTFRAQVTRLDSSTLALGSPLSTRLSVLPSQLVSLVLIAPQEASTRQNITEGFPPIIPTDLEVIFEARVDDTPVDVEALAADRTTLWTARVLNDGVAVSDLDTTVRADSASIGRYRLRFPGLETGRYTVEVAAVGTLSANYILNPAARTITVLVERVVNPLYTVTLAASGVTGVALVGVAVILLRRRQKNSRHPARGNLIIREQTTGSVLMTIDLERFKSNTITIRDRRLQKAGIKRLHITCPDDKMSQTRRVRVSAIKDSKRGQEYMFRDRVLSPGDSAALKKGNAFSFGSDDEDATYEVVKDPNEALF